MKKKLLTVALAAVMTVSSALSAFAATADVNITGGLGSGNTGDEELTGDFDVTYTFHNASADTSGAWFNFAAELYSKGADDALSHITMRADAFGVGTGDYADDLGTWGGTALTTWTGACADATEWAAFSAGMADADVTVNVKRAGKVLTFTYDIKTADKTYNFVGTTPEIADLADTLFIHITGEKVNLTNVKFTKNEAAANSTEATTTAAPSEGETTTAAAGATDATTAATNNTAANTGDSTMVAALLAVAALSAVVVLKKKSVTE